MVNDKILINGFSSNVGGGKVILDSFIRYSPKGTVIICPRDHKENSVITHNGVVLLKPPRFLYSKFSITFFYLIWIPFICKKYKINKIFNLGDLIIPFFKGQTYFFDWAYLVVPESPIWDKMSMLDRFLRVLKLNLIKFFIRNNSRIIVQSRDMFVRMNDLLEKKRVTNCSIDILFTPVNFENSDLFDPNISLKITSSDFVYIASCGPHKNFEIIPEVIINLSNVVTDFRICLTVEHSSPIVKSIYEILQPLGLSHHFINLGPLNRIEVESVLRNCGGLLYPTLLESYGIPLVEAMTCNCPIIASDFSFIRSVCGETPFYFNPLDATSISDAILYKINNPVLVESKILNGKNITSNIHEWESYVQLCLKV